MVSMVLKLLLLALCLQVAYSSVDIVVGSPIKAIYIDWHLNWNAPDQSVLGAVSAGYNVIIISFYLSSGSAADMAQAWAALNDTVKQQTVAKAHGAGAVVIVSLGGSTDSPYGKNPTALGAQVGQWALQQHLDGVDFDLENINQGFTAGGMSAQQTVDWIANVSVSAAKTIGSGAVITHAPQGPYFGPIGATNTWAGTTGGYTSVYKQAANYITFFNTQFYNQGASCYADYNGLFVSSGASCPVFPNTAVAEIAAAGVPLSKIVVGKPVTSADASNGWVSGSTLNGFFQQAKGMGWNTGVMGWVWNDPNTCQSWIQSIYGGGGSNTGVTVATSAHSVTTAATTSPVTSTSSSTTGSANCAQKNGMYCVSQTQFEWCPQQIIQSCAPGTNCVQSGSTISCQ